MILKIENLNKSYGEKTVLKNVNYTFENGKIYGLLGRNGAGKTTFFNALNQDIKIESGSIKLDDEELTYKDIGYVISSPIVPEFLTGKEFLKFFIDINEDIIENKLSIEEYFKLVGIKEKDQNKLLKDYSTGMKNKIQILINIIKNPKVLLLDEPLTSLDIVVQEEIKNILKDMKKEHIVIFSTHILELATDLCDEIVIISNNELERIPKSNLNKNEYKNKIINALKEEKDD